MNETLLFIHGIGSFLSWHRYFVWAFEEALRDECDYFEYQPDWNRGKYADALKTPLFDGSEASMPDNEAYASLRQT
ncbi:hypothetical protein CPB83DRAFT_852958 [Crepidotus variabilis]|uniref:Tyrosinase copper-binding domain-containing protein n=1 Tax=Crepidotus variabilis TaxID=179855 RepID=A0A9P6EI08_9AGAR|nr:hypothetical protein CPB83DRAFT_852958 [Crepidotus variabilis]